ncbi:MAG: hypothetical protein ACFB4I_13485 [Cyanophyceae cyanobacterium]
MNSDWLRRPIVKLCLGLLVVLLVGGRIYWQKTEPVVAQSARTSSELLNLRTRVNLLENEVRRLRQIRQRRQPEPSRIEPRSPRPVPSPDPTASPPQVVDGQIIGRSDPIVQRLATLAIELKERITVLEKKTAELEQQLETLKES